MARERFAYQNWTESCRHQSMPTIATFTQQLNLFHEKSCGRSMKSCVQLARRTAAEMVRWASAGRRFALALTSTFTSCYSFISRLIPAASLALTSCITLTSTFASPTNPPQHHTHPCTYPVTPSPLTHTTLVHTDQRIIYSELKKENARQVG